MSESNPYSTDRGLIYEGHLPLNWSRVPALPAAAERAELEHANLEILRTLSALEAHTGELGEEGAEPGSQDLARLDFKLNLLLDLLGQLLIRQLHIPEARQLTLMPSAILWREDNAPAIGSLLRIDLYLNMKYPRPLVLYGRIREVYPLPEGPLMAQAEFVDLSDPVREGLERFVFVHHRRAIAYSRRRGRNSSQ